MGVDGGLYKAVFVLHLVAVVVGFGTVALDGVTLRIAQRQGGSEGAAIGEATLALTRVARGFLLAVPVLGALLVVLSDGVWGFDQLWTVASLVLWFLAVGASDMARRVPAAGVVRNLLVVVVISLMVWKPR